jgi:hypothetical protein
MKDPLFQTIAAPLTQEEEAAITRRLAEAYRQHEEAEKKPELERIVSLVAKKLASEFSDSETKGQGDPGRAP